MRCFTHHSQKACETNRMRPSQPRRGPPGEARVDAVVSRASQPSTSSNGSNAGPHSLFRRSAFDVAVVGAGAPAAAAAAASARAGLRTVWLDGAPAPPPSDAPHGTSSIFHRRPSHAPARLACSDARLVALASEGLDAWRSLDERFAGKGGRRRSRNSSLLSEGGSLDLASAAAAARSNSTSCSGTEILEACAEASREAGVRGVRLLAASEIEAALGMTGAGGGGGGGRGGLSLLSSNLPARSAGLFLPLGGSLCFAAADEAAAADAASAGVERWGPGFALAGWRDAGGGSRFELRGERIAATTAAGEEAAPLAEVERLVLVPPERGSEEFLACFGLALPERRDDEEDEDLGARLLDVPWAPVGGGGKGGGGTVAVSSSSPSLSQLTPCVLCHGLADRAADPGAPRGGAFERWVFVPSNGGGGFGGSVSVPPAFARGSLSAAVLSDAAAVVSRREASLDSRESGGEEEGEEAAEEESLFSSPFAEDAKAAAAAASSVLRPLAGSPVPRNSFAFRTLVTRDGAPLCGWAPLEVVEEGEEEGGGRGGSGSKERQQLEEHQNRRANPRASFGALGTQSGRVLVLSPAAAGSGSDAIPWGGPSHGLLSVPVVARAAADLLSGFSAVTGPLASEALSPTRKAVGLRCVQLTRDSWEGSR